MPSRIFSLRLSLFNAVLFLGSGIQLPFLPLWLKDKGLTDAQIALVVALMMAVRILAMPLGTSWPTSPAPARGDHRLRLRRLPRPISLLHVMSGFWPILVTAMLAAALLAPVVPLTETLAVEGSAHYGLDYGRIRLWASLSFLSGSLVAGALLEFIPVSWVILLIAAAQGLGALVTLRCRPTSRVPRRTAASRSSLRPSLAVVGAASFIVFMLAAGLGQASHGFLYAFGSVYFEHLGYSKFVIGMLWAASVLAEVTMFAFSNRFYRAFGSVAAHHAGHGACRAALDHHGARPAARHALRWCRRCMRASFGLTHLGTMHYIRERVPANMRNTAQGLYSVLSSGMLLSGTMWASGTLYGALGGGAFFVMAGISALACGLAVLLRRSAPEAAGGGCMRLPSKRMPGSRSCLSSSGPSRSTTSASGAAARPAPWRARWPACSPTMISRSAWPAPHGRARWRGVRPPVLSSLMLMASYLPTSSSSVSRPWADLSAQTVTARDSAASASSLPAGSGCSTSSTPASAQAASIAASVSGVQPSLASTMRRLCGRVAADELQPLGIALAAELQLEQRAVGGLRRRLAHRLRRVEAQRVGGDDGLRLRQAGELPDGLSGLLRSRSHSAQSSALRAAWGASKAGISSW